MGRFPKAEAVMREAGGTLRIADGERFFAFQRDDRLNFVPMFAAGMLERAVTVARQGG